MPSISTILDSVCGGTQRDTPPTLYEYHTQVGRMCSDFRGDPHHKQFKPALTPDHNARTTMDTDSRDALKSWLGKEFPKDEGRFKRDTRQVFTCDAAPEESPTLLSVIGSASPHNQPQKSKIIYSVKGDKSGTCRVQNLENGHYEIVSTNLKYHGSMFEQPSGDAKESLQNRIGLKSLGNLSLSCQDVEAAWFQKGPERGQGTLCWIPRITEDGIQEESATAESDTKTG